LITGENGTGKELVARTIHQLSPRVDQPLIDVNCAAIPDEMIESELFGHEKGALSGAITKKIGKFEFASNGTIFLDEIGDMSLMTQSKILRVLQEQKIQRVGGSRTISINVRVIAASNKNLELEINQGNFRKDLYYRLNVIPIVVPPLRQRIDDIPILVNSFLDEFANQNRGNRKTITGSALDMLCSYSWPGNVRELKNLIERLVIMVDKDDINSDDIPVSYNPAIGKHTATFGPQFTQHDKFKEARKAFEKEFIRVKLIENKNNITRTAEAIGVGRSYLHKKIKSLK
jgi:two-component system nitrogen regulation response regulator NtrX